MVQLTWCAIRYFTHFTQVVLFIPLKTSEYQRFSDVFRVYRRWPVGWYGLIFFLKIRIYSALHIPIHCVKSVQTRSFFWSVFSRIRTEYRDLRSKSPYSSRILENADQKKNSVFGHFSHRDLLYENWNIQTFARNLPPWTQDLNWTYQRDLQDVLDVLCSFKLLSVPKGYNTDQQSLFF